MPFRRIRSMLRSFGDSYSPKPYEFIGFRSAFISQTPVVPLLGLDFTSDPQIQTIILNLMRKLSLPGFRLRWAYELIAILGP